MQKKGLFCSLVLMTLGVKLPVVLAVFQITFKVRESMKNFEGVIDVFSQIFLSLPFILLGYEASFLGFFTLGQPLSYLEHWVYWTVRPEVFIEMVFKMAAGCKDFNIITWDTRLCLSVYLQCTAVWESSIHESLLYLPDLVQETHTCKCLEFDFEKII